MRNAMGLVILAALAPCGIGCASYPAPTEKMANTTAATRSAEELGANKNPQAELHLRLAQEALTRAKQLIEDGENKRAESVLLRAQADAELAVMLAREAATRAEAEKAQEGLKALKHPE